MDAIQAQIEELETQLTQRLGRHSGLNSDWSVSVWAVGGGLFVTDNEDETYSIVTRFEPEWDEIEEVETFDSERFALLLDTVDRLKA